MKRVEQIITMARQLSQNTRYDANGGIPQSVFVQFLNNAQDSLMKNVANVKTKFTQKTQTVTVVPNQIRYDFPVDLYMQHMDTVQWTDNVTSGVYFQNLIQTYVKEKIASLTGYPFGYYIQEDGIYMNPPIGNGQLIFTYTKKPNSLQIKNGQITARTINGSNQITALTVSTSGAYDSAQINDDYYLCVVDKHGVQKAKNIEYTSESGGVFTLSPQTLGTGETITVGDFIVIGKNSTNQPEWPDICESYLIKHMVYDAKYSDSSQWSQEAKEDMRVSFADLISSFASKSDDLQQIALTNLDYIGF